MSATDTFVCRLCGRDRPIPTDRNPISKEKFKDKILCHTGVDVGCDHAGHPPYICLACSLKLTKMTKAKSKNKQTNMKFDIPDFKNPTAAEVSESVETCQNGETPMMLFRQETARASATHGNFVDVSGTGEVDQCVFVTLEPVTASIKFKLVVNSDFTWNLSFRNRPVNKTLSALKDYPERLSASHFNAMLAFISESSICAGNDSMQVVIDDCKLRNEFCLYGIDQTVVGLVHDNVVHSVNCTVFMPPGSSGSCEACRQFRSNLRARVSHIRKMAATSTDKTSANSNVPFSKLSESEKEERFKNLSKTVKHLRGKLQVQKMVDQESVNVTEGQHNIFSEIVKNQKYNVLGQFDEGTPERLFWEQQLKACNVKSAKGMRWHPHIIKWCISIYSKSPSAYEQLSKAGLVKLPHCSTLKEYMNFTESLPDINPDILETVAEQFGLGDDIPDYKKNVSLVWDEMAVKSGLALSKHTGKLVGFCETGDTELGLQGLFDLKEPELATHILVLMVRGLQVHVNLPFMWYPGKTFFALELHKIVWRATGTLENMGLYVRSWVCDGASQNRAMFAMHKQVGLAYDGVTYGTINKFDRKRHIFFVCDVPHLLKTVRNNLENSNANTKSKNLVKSGQSISWAHIVSTVKLDKEMDLQRLYRIKEEHIHLSPQLRMRVRLAAQILSATMANALKARNLPHLNGTADFCAIMNKWFDCLNGRYLTEGREKRNPDLDPYWAEQPDDPRYTWLGSTFLGWLREWESEVEGMSDLSKSDKNKLMLSKQTTVGLKITTVSFISLAKTLLQEPGSQFLLPEKLNQDRIETFFGKLRRGCGDSDYPTIDQARHRLLTLLVAGRCFIPPRGRNCEVNDDVGMATSLPSRKKHRV